ncbi:MAG: exosortase-associated EpsI family protein [Verrucomicrobiota bacterium]
MKLSRKQIALGGLCGLAATIALVWPALPMAEGPNRLATIPLEGPDFHSVPMDLTPADTKFLAGATAVQRVVHPRHGAPFMLTVIDGSGNRHAVHDPTYCLAGGGWNILTQQKLTMPSGEATWLSMEKDGVKMEALWFFDDGNEQFTSPITYWSRASLRRATRGHSGSEPLLVMLRIPPGESADWKRIPQVLLPALGFR